MTSRRWKGCTHWAAWASVLAGVLALPMLAQAETSSSRHTMLFSELDGSAADRDGMADGTLTLDQLKLDDSTEILIDRPNAIFAVTGDFELAGRSSIRPAAGPTSTGPTVQIRAASIHLLGRATLSVDGRNAGGSLKLCSSGAIEIEDRTRIFAQALDGKGPGGSVTLEAGDRLALRSPALVVRASGGSGGTVTLVSCDKDGSIPGHPRVEAAILVHGHIEAVGASGAGGTVTVEARQGAVDFRPSAKSDEGEAPSEKSPAKFTINARGTTRTGNVSVHGATRVYPPAPPTWPAAAVVTGSPSTVPCDCSSGGSGGDTAVIAIDLDRTTGVTGTPFQLSGRVVKSAAPIASWDWLLSDGQTLSGQTVSASFPSPGIYSAQLTATDQNGQATTTETGLQVFDPATQAPPELGLPPLVGDVDGDGQITLRDALKIAQHAGGLTPLPSNVVPTADVDLDRQVTASDALLLGQAVAAGQTLPSVLLPDHGMPGGRVNLISPQLLDPLAKIEVEFGDSAWVQEPLRPARGYATLLVPLDVTNRGTAQVTPGPVTVRIRRDGNVVETFTFQVEEPPPLPADPKAELISFLNDQLSLITLNQQAVQELLGITDISADQKALILASFTLAQDRVSSEVAQLRALLDQPGGDELARLFFRYADAVGYPAYRQGLAQFLETNGAEIRAEIQSIKLSGKASVDQILGLVCNLKKAAETIDTAGNIAGWLCDVALLAAIAGTVVTPGGEVLDPVLLYGWANICGTAEAFLEIPLLIDEFFKDAEPNLRFEASTETPSLGETVTLRAKIELVGVDDLCNFAIGSGSDKLISKLAQKAVERLLTKKLVLKAVSDLLKLLSPKALEKIEGGLADILARTISSSELGTALEEFAHGVCGQLNAGVPLTDDLSKILTGPDPTVGTLTFPGDGSAQYLCPDVGKPSASSVTFTATRSICDKQQQKQVMVKCQSRQVTITMGDNGNLLDDIFEVRVDGVTVLTSSEPVVSISTTIDLQPGDHTVEMIGRAAPDGIGTYFIEFSGADLVSGDPLTGDDLTPGVVKTFIINVQ